ncbi:MAG: nodulation protein NfeD [Paludibacteraceae bacterium]|nr:nodulation protein NfeD [Paludibacteraceae bacterium]
MRKFYIIYIFVTITLSFLIGNLNAEDKKTTIFVIELKKDIGGTAWVYCQKGFDQAKEKKADIILIHMNTYGGEVVFADSIRTRILNSTIPVYVFIDNNAASAGALIAIACDKIFMRPGAAIGAATVVNNTGQQMPDKYQSYMRATMRTTAEAHGKDTIIQGKDTLYRWKRDPKIAEAMVDDKVSIPGIIEEGKTLTFTAEEAMNHGYCDGIAESIDEIIKKNISQSDYEIVVFQPNFWDRLKGFFSGSVIRSILIMLIIGGIYFELQAPGIGFPLAVSIMAAVLFFVPLYIDGLAANWEILIFLLGLILLALEIFVIPGFGVAGISGILFIVAGLTLSLINNVNFNFEAVQKGTVGKSLLTVLLGITLGFVLILYLSNKIGSKGILRKVALNTVLENKEGYVGVPMDKLQLVGKTGYATTILRPSGKVNVEGKVYDAVSTEGFIEKGEQVRVIEYQTGQIYVEKI